MSTSLHLSPAAGTWSPTIKSWELSTDEALKIKVDSGQCHIFFAWLSCYTLAYLHGRVCLRYGYRWRQRLKLLLKVASFVVSPWNTFSNNILQAEAALCFETNFQYMLLEGTDGDSNSGCSPCVQCLITRMLSKMFIWYGNYSHYTQHLHLTLCVSCVPYLKHWVNVMHRTVYRVLEQYKSWYFLNGRFQPWQQIASFSTWTDAPTYDILSYNHC